MKKPKLKLDSYASLTCKITQIKGDSVRVVVPDGSDGIDCYWLKRPNLQAVPHVDESRLQETPYWGRLPNPASVPDASSITDEIKEYRAKFRDIMDGWDWETPREVLLCLYVELSEYRNDLDPHDLNSEALPQRVAEGVADIIIIAMEYLIRQDATADLQHIVSSRIANNLDRALRAKEAAAIKDRSPRDEWPTTNRREEV